MDSYIEDADLRLRSGAAVSDRRPSVSGRSVSAYQRGSIVKYPAGMSDEYTLGAGGGGALQLSQPGFWPGTPGIRPGTLGTQPRKSISVHREGRRPSVVVEVEAMAVAVGKVIGYGTLLCATLLIVAGLFNALLPGTAREAIYNVLMRFLTTIRQGMSGPGFLRAPVVGAIELIKPFCEQSCRDVRGRLANCQCLAVWAEDAKLRVETVVARSPLASLNEVLNWLGRAPYTPRA